MQTGALTIEGTAEPGVTVYVMDDLEVIGSTTAEPDGTWRVEVDSVQAGALELTAGVEDPTTMIMLVSDVVNVTVE